MANYINAYQNQAQYDSDDTKQYPNVSLLKDSGTIVHVKEAPKPYLTLVAEEAGTFKFLKNGTGNDIQYSVDGGETWTTLASNTNSPTVPVGGKIMFKATLIPNYGDGIGRFSSTGRFTAKGNPMCLLFGDDFEDKTSLSGKTYALYRLFYECTGLTSAENLSLPATTLANSCYYYMFNGCTSLTTAPELPATTLATECYNGMFTYCTSLTTAPSLPTTTLVNKCYMNMFQYCTSLTTAPELPATTLASSCYYGMFGGCSSLTTAPALPVTTLVKNCYQTMFYGCTSLNSIICLATNISASNCTYYWVDGVAASGTFTKDASMSSWTTDNNGIPSGWTVQDYQP